MRQIDFKYFKAFLNKILGNTLQILLYSADENSLFLFTFPWLQILCLLAKWRKKLLALTEIKVIRVKSHFENCHTPSSSNARELTLAGVNKFCHVLPVSKVGLRTQGWVPWFAVALWWKEAPKYFVSHHNIWKQCYVHICDYFTV